MADAELLAALPKHLSKHVSISGAAFSARSGGASRFGNCRLAPLSGLGRAPGNARQRSQPKRQGTVPPWESAPKIHRLLDQQRQFSSLKTKPPLRLRIPFPLPFPVSQSNITS